MTKNCQKRRTRTCACSPWDCGLPPSRSPVSPFGSRSQRLRNSVVTVKACSRSGRPAGVWAIALRILLRFQLPRRQPRQLFATIDETKVDSAVRQARHRCVRAARRVVRLSVKRYWCHTFTRLYVLRRKAHDEVRRRKRAENKWRRGTCQETSSQKQNPKF